MFYQHVAGSLTWITTAVSTAPSPSVAQSANSVSSHLAFSFLQEEKTLLVFLYEFEKDAIQDGLLKCAGDITRPIG